jgi:tyrosyl-DNA phosphodiesterase 2
VDVIGAPRTIDFPSSKMGRSALSVRLSLKSKPQNPVECITAHLESLRESSSERKKQLSVIQAHIDEILDKRSIQRVVFAGDLNIRDNEVPEKFKSNDCWVKAGRDKDSEYTWDLQRNDNASLPNGGKPRCRFDRMYGFSPGTVSFTVESFQLVGTERVQGLDRFPSDHFGILASFKV